MSSPCWSMTRRVVSSSWMVTVCPAWREAGLDALAGDLDAAAAGHLPLDGQPGWREWLGPARRTPWRRCRWPGGMGQGRVRHRMPFWVMTCMTWPSRRIRARCPASGEPTWMTWLRTRARRGAADVAGDRPLNRLSGAWRCRCRILTAVDGWMAAHQPALDAAPDNLWPLRRAIQITHFWCASRAVRERGLMPPRGPVLRSARCLPGQVRAVAGGWLGPLGIG